MKTMIAYRLANIESLRSTDYKKGIGVSLHIIEGSEISVRKVGIDQQRKIVARDDRYIFYNLKETETKQQTPPAALGNKMTGVTAYCDQTSA